MKDGIMQKNLFTGGHVDADEPTNVLGETSYK